MKCETSKQRLQDCIIQIFGRKSRYSCVDLYTMSLFVTKIKFKQKTVKQMIPETRKKTRKSDENNQNLEAQDTQPNLDQQPQETDKANQNSPYVNHEVYDQANFDQQPGDMSCMLYSASAAISEQLYQRTEGKIKVPPNQFYEQFMLEYDKDSLNGIGGLSGAQLANEQNGTQLSYTYEKMIGWLRVEFKPFKADQDPSDKIDNDKGATFIAIKPNQSTGLAQHAVFVYGVDKESKSYKYLEQSKRIRDNPANFKEVNGVKSSTLKVLAWKFDPEINKEATYQMLICKITESWYHGRPLELKHVNIFDSKAVKDTLAVDYSTAYLCKPLLYTEYIQYILKDHIIQTIKGEVSKKQLMNPTGDQYEYTGQVDDQEIPCGGGVLRSTDGDYYNGTWLQGFFHGKGVYKWSDGKRYSGERKKGLRHGKGTMYHVDGRIFNCVFRNGELTWMDNVTEEPGKAFYRVKQSGRS